MVKNTKLFPFLLPLLRKHYSTLILLVLFIFIVIQRGPSYLENLKIEGTQTPKLAAETLSGVKLPFPPAIHQPQVLVFWATWCGPCKLELSRLRSLIEEHPEWGDRVHLISTQEAPQLVDSVVRERKYPFAIWLDSSQEVFSKFKVNATPTTVLIDEKNEIRHISTGLSPAYIWRIEKHLRGN